MKAMRAIAERISRTGPRSRFALLAVAVIALSVALSLAADGDASASPTDVLVRGKVTFDESSRDTAAFRSGTPLIVTAVLTDTPQEASLGQDWSQPILASTEIADDGRFSLAASKRTVPTAYVAASGAVNIGLYFNRGEEFVGAHHVVVYAPSAPDSSWITAPTANTAFDLAVRIKGGHIEVTETALDAPDFAHGLTAPNQTQIAGHIQTQMMQNQPLGCTSAKRIELGDFDTIMQTIGSNSRYVSFDYEFNSSGSDDDSLWLGVAVADTSQPGWTWSQAGRRRVDSSVSLGFEEVTVTGHQHYMTKTRYAGWEVTCPLPGSPGLAYTGYEMRPSHVTGDAWTEWQLPFSGTHCTRLGPGADVVREKGSTIWWANGVRLEATLGVPLEVKNELMTGFSHKVVFKNNAHSTFKYVCGEYAKIGNTDERSGLLVGDWRD